MRNQHSRPAGLSQDPPSDKNDAVYRAAVTAVRRGRPVLPIDHSTKRPHSNMLPTEVDTETGEVKATWKPYQTRLPDDAELGEWFQEPLAAKALAVVCGSVPPDAKNGLLVIDFDHALFYREWREAVGDLADGLAIQKTGSVHEDHYQAFAMCPEPGANSPLAWVPDEAQKAGRRIAIETRGTGGYACIPPSLHPEGGTYQWVQGDFNSIPTISQARADALLGAARKLDEAPRTRQQMEARERQAKECSTHRASSNGSVSVIDEYNRRTDIEGALKQYGYTKGVRGMWCRPGREAHLPSITVKDGRSFHHSTNDVMNDGYWHRPFDLMCEHDHGGDCKAAVRAAALSLGMSNSPTSTRTQAAPSDSAEPWPNPEPLPPGEPPVPAFDYELLPESLRPWVRDVADRMQCPPDFCAVTVFVAAGMLIGRQVAIRPKCHDDWQVVPNLFGMCVGPPSVMKTPAMKEMLKFLTRKEIEAKQQYAEDLDAYSANKLVAEARKKVKAEELKAAVKSKKGDPDAIAKDMTAADEGNAPVRRRYVVNDTTVEKLGIILSENPNGVLVFCDELVSLLRSMDREGHEPDRGFYLTAWDGTLRYSYDRVARGTLDIEAAIVSVVGSIQPGVIAAYLREAVKGGSGDDGLMQRFQLSVWPDVPATWRNIDRYPDADAKSLATAAFERLVDLDCAAIGVERDNFDRDALPFLRFDAQAQRAFDGWRGNLEQRLRSGAEHPALEAHLAKYRSLVPSLALIVHLLDEGEHEASGWVGLASFERALAWVEYLEGHARRLYAGVTRGAAVAARELAKRIQSGDVSDPFAARDVYRKDWTGLDREAVESAIDVLVSLRWLEERADATPGRTRTRYAINPKIVISPKKPPTKPTKAPSVGSVGSPDAPNPSTKPPADDGPVFDGDVGDDGSGPPSSVGDGHVVEI